MVQGSSEDKFGNCTTPTSPPSRASLSSPSSPKNSPPTYETVTIEEVKSSSIASLESQDLEHSTTDAETSYVENAAQSSRSAWSEFDFSNRVLHPTKLAVSNFFFTSDQPASAIDRSDITPFPNFSEDEYEKVESFWRTYDDIVILSLMSQLGVLFRIFTSSMLSRTDSNTFHEGSALFTTLPLNVISCVLLGVLSDGDEAMKCIRRESGEYRNVQIEGLERRIRTSQQSLVLFPAKRQEEDVLERYQHDHNEAVQNHEDELTYSVDFDYTNSSRSVNDAPSMANATATTGMPSLPTTTTVNDANNKAHNITDSNASPPPSTMDRRPTNEIRVDVSRYASTRSIVTVDTDEVTDNIHDLIRAPPGHISPVQDKTSNSTEPPEQMNAFETLQSISNGWDINTTPTAMASDLMLGLRVGFCGALSSFASWNSEMVGLLKSGQVGQGLMGYIIGICLPILGYRMGVHIAVYIFALRCRRERKKDEKRGGYGIRPPTSEREDEDESQMSHSPPHSPRINTNEISINKQTPSVRAFATAIFMMALVTEITAILVFPSPQQQQFALQLLFSPLGVLLRWKLNKCNGRLHSFPLGTFFANMLSCLLSGSVGVLLAGNPGPEERIFLTSLISGLGGTLSTLALFVVQVLNGIDPIIMRWDGVMYGFVTIFWGAIIGLFTEQSKNWADNL